MIGQRIKYSTIEQEFLQANEKTPRRELTKLFNAKFIRNLSYTNINAKCKRMGLRTGRTGQFEKGRLPFNKGTKGLMKWNKTSFKKGSVPHNAKPIGYERTTVDGYVQVLINETNPHTGYPNRFVLKHRHIWEQANGKIPKGCILIFKDGNSLNVELDNLEMITRSEHVLLNKAGHKQAPDELKPTIRAIAKLQSTAFKKISRHKKSPINSNQQGLTS